MIMQLNVSDEFKERVLEGEAEFTHPKKGLFLGRAIKKANKIVISNQEDKTIIQCYDKKLLIGDWTVPEVRFERGDTLTIANIDLRLDFMLD